MPYDRYGYWTHPYTGNHYKSPKHYTRFISDLRILRLGRLKLSASTAGDKELRHRRHCQANQIKQWEKRVATHTFTIELKLNLDDGETERQEAMLMVVKQTARDLLSSATLLNTGKRQPGIICFTEDGFMDQKEIEVLDPSDT